MLSLEDLAQLKGVHSCNLMVIEITKKRTNLPFETLPPLEFVTQNKKSTNINYHTINKHKLNQRFTINVDKAK